MTLVKYGMIPEFIGRFTTTINVEEIKQARTNQGVDNS